MSAQQRPDSTPMSLTAHSRYAPGTAPAAVKQAARGIEYRGRWANPAGWEARHMWTGRTLRHDPPKAMRIVRNDDGEADIHASMATATRGAGAVRFAPEVILVHSLAEYEDGLRRGWKDASELPADKREMLLDCYGSDLTPVMREICAAQIAARQAQKAKPVESSTTTKPTKAAGRAPRKARKDVSE